MKNNELRIITITKDINLLIIKSLSNCPKEYIDIKKKVIDELLNYLKDIYIANDISDNNKRKYLKEIVLYKTKYISSLINLLYELKLINNKVYLDISSKIDVLLRLIKGWIKI